MTVEANFSYGVHSAASTVTHSSAPCVLHAVAITGGGAAGVLAGDVSILDNTTVLLKFITGALPPGGIVLDADITTSLKTTLGHADDQLVITFRNR